MKWFRRVGMVGVLSLTGCGTIADTFNPGNSEYYIGRGPNVMGGLRMDIAHLGDSGSKGLATPVYIVDIPFSFVLDIALLPFTIPYAIFRPKPGTAEGYPRN